MISRKKLIPIILLVILVVSLGLTDVLAVTLQYGPTSSWSYSDYSHGSYVPKSGSLATQFWNYDTTLDEAKTLVTFSLDQSNVTNILDYNNGGDNPGTYVDNCNCYLTCDVRNYPTGSNDMMDAYYISSTLPNPKTDLENDDPLGNRNEEAEVVALGTVQAASYSMTTLWNDYRSGGLTDNGYWNCQFSMSGQYVKIFGAWVSSSGDYNTMIMSDVTQASCSYGKISGQP